MKKYVIHLLPEDGITKLGYLGEFAEPLALYLCSYDIKEGDMVHLKIDKTIYPPRKTFNNHAHGGFWIKALENVPNDDENYKIGVNLGEDFKIISKIDMTSHFAKGLKEGDEFDNLDNF